VFVDKDVPPIVLPDAVLRVSECAMAVQLVLVLKYQNYLLKILLALHVELTVLMEQAATQMVLDFATLANLDTHSVVYLTVSLAVQQPTLDVLHAIRTLHRLPALRVEQNKVIIL